MKNRFGKSLSVALVLLMSAVLTDANAQGPLMPSPSSKQKIEQQLGTSKVVINYSRPNSKGRKVFGELVPYGEMWRTGADKLTDITVEKEISVAGNLLAPGKYSIISIPGAKSWTIIFNREADLWGAADHDAAKDVFRFEVKPLKVKDKQETFQISFDDVTAFTMNLQLRWENMLVEFPVSINQDQEVEAAIEAAIARGEKPYVSAAIFYLNNNKDLNKALGWMNIAEKETGDVPFIHYWKGAVQFGLGQKAEALASAKKSLALAEEVGNKDYIRMNKALIKKIN